MKSMKFFLALILLAPVLSFRTAQADETPVPAPALTTDPAPAATPADLNLPDARHLTVFNRYVCRSFEDATIVAPRELADREIVFEKLIGDAMIIQFLITASFKEQNSTCHYSAILSRAVIRNALVKVNSKAYSNDANIDCSGGQAQIDALFARSTYDYTTKPIRFISLKIPSVESAAGQICKPDAKGGVRLVFERVRR